MIAPEERLLEVVPRLEVVGLDCLVVVRDVRLLGLKIGGEEMPDRDEEVDPRELDPELRPLELLLDEEAGGDFLRFLLACDGGAARTSTPIETRRIAV